MGYQWILDIIWWKLHWIAQIFSTCIGIINHISCNVPGSRVYEQQAGYLAKLVVKRISDTATVTIIVNVILCFNYYQISSTPLWENWCNLNHLSPDKPFLDIQTIAWLSGMLFHMIWLKQYNKDIKLITTWLFDEEQRDTTIRVLQGKSIITCSLKPTRHSPGYRTKQPSIWTKQNNNIKLNKYVKCYNHTTIIIWNIHTSGNN